MIASAQGALELSAVNLATLAGYKGLMISAGQEESPLRELGVIVATK